MAGVNYGRGVLRYGNADAQLNTALSSLAGRCLYFDVILFLMEWLLDSMQPKMAVGVGFIVIRGEVCGDTGNMLWIWSPGELYWIADRFAFTLRHALRGVAFRRILSLYRLSYIYGS